jgi:hypothetical protein
MLIQKEIEMVKLWKKTAVTFAVLALSVSFILFGLSWNNVFLFTKNLDAQMPYTGGYAFFEDSGNRVGDMWLTTDPVNGLLCQMSIYVNHYNHTVLDSVTFKFSKTTGQGNIVVYLESGYPNNPVSTTDNKGVTTITLKPFGSAATGTFSFHFVVEPFGAESVTLTTELTMHQEALLQFTCLKTSVTMEQQFTYT